MKIDGEWFRMTSGDTIHIVLGVVHSFTGITDATILEISTQHFEADSYREDTNGKILK